MVAAVAALGPLVLLLASAQRHQDHAGRDHAQRAHRRHSPHSPLVLPGRGRRPRRIAAAAFLLPAVRYRAEVAAAAAAVATVVAGDGERGDAGIERVGLEGDLVAEEPASGRVPCAYLSRKPIMICSVCKDFFDFSYTLHLKKISNYTFIKLLAQFCRTATVKGPASKTTFCEFFKEK